MDKKTHHVIYQIALILIAMGLLFSKSIISIATIILLFNWLLEKNLKIRFQSIFKNTFALGIISIFLIHILGLLWTNNDFSYAIKDIRIKLPLLILPLIIATSSKRLNEKEIFRILSFFIFAVFCSSIYCFYLYTINLQNINFNYRESSIFISHIRLAMMVVFSIFIVEYYLKKKSNLSTKIISILLISWFILFIFILKSLTGIIIFSACLLYTIIYKIFAIRRKIYKTYFSALLVLISIFLIIYINKQLFDFYNIKQPNTNSKTFTINGELYNPNTKNNQIENGYYINKFIAKNELKKAWNQRSKIKFNALTKNNQNIDETLIRYLTSKGVTKDSLGVYSLQSNEIKAIENGICNVRYLNNSFSIKNIIYRVIWEIDFYLEGANPSGNSITQRIEFFKAGWNILKKKPILGVGTGDLPIEFKKSYEEIQSPLYPKYRKRAHNQFLTFGITFGIFAVFWFVFVLYLNFFKTANSNFLTSIFIIIIVTNMLYEDTLETQVGVTFFSFFTSILLYSKSTTQKNSLLYHKNQ